MADGFKQIDELQTVDSLNELNRQLSTLFDLVAGDGNTLRVYSGYGAPTLAANNGSIYLRIDGAVATTVYARVSGAWQSIPSGSSAGDVVGPASATDNAIVRFDGTTGKLIQNSSATIDDSSNLSNTASTFATATAASLNSGFIWICTQTSTGGVNGLGIQGKKTGAGGSNNVNGISSGYLFTGSGTQVDAASFNSAPLFQTGAVTNGYALYCSTPLRVVNGTITNSYGVYIAAQIATGITNGYGIYQASTSDLNIFAGNTRIGGTSSPSYALDVTGKIAHSGGIVPRVVSVSDATSITPNIDTSDIVSQANTQAAGTLTINAHSGTPVDGQKFILRVNCTNAQALSWNSAYLGSADLSLPSGTTGSSKTDYFGFQYYSSSSKWHLLAKTQGF